MWVRTAINDGRLLSARAFSSASATASTSLLRSALCTCEPRAANRAIAIFGEGEPRAAFDGDVVVSIKYDENAHCLFTVEMS
jgi:hypothetical protein